MAMSRLSHSAAPFSMHVIPRLVHDNISASPSALSGKDTYRMDAPLDVTSGHGISFFVMTLLLLGRVALGAQRLIVIKLPRGLSVGLCVGRSVSSSVCPVHCEKTADRIRMPKNLAS